MALDVVLPNAPPSQILSLVGRSINMPTTASIVSKALHGAKSLCYQRVTISLGQENQKALSRQLLGY
jgi:hypothetical protein